MPEICAMAPGVRGEALVAQMLMRAGLIDLLFIYICIHTYPNYIYVYRYMYMCMYMCIYICVHPKHTDIEESGARLSPQSKPRKLAQLFLYSRVYCPAWVVYAKLYLLTASLCMCVCLHRYNTIVDEYVQLNDARQQLL